MGLCSGVLLLPLVALALASDDGITATRWPATQDLVSVANGTSGVAVVATSPTLFVDAGVSAPVGDVDGDRVPDIALVGSGAVHVILGPLSPSSSSPSAWQSSPSVLRRKLVDGTAFRIGAPVCDGKAAVGVASAGDVNGDGLGDVAVVCDGVAYVLLGRNRSVQWPRDTYSISGAASASFVLSSWCASAAGVGDVDGDGCGDLGVVRSDGTFAVLFGRRSAWPHVVDLGANGTVSFGVATAFAGVGDVNGDGVGDLVVADRSAQPAGSAFLVRGRKSFARSIDLRSADGVTEFRGVAGSGVVAGVAVAGVGDVDADNVTDFVVCLSRDRASRSGRYLVVYGSKTLTWPRTYDIGSSNASATGVRAATILANAIGDTGAERYESTAASAGDIDGDGVGDAVLCHYGVDQGSMCTLVLGSPRAGLSNRTVELVGAYPSSWMLGATAGPLGDIDGDGRGDLLLGAPALGSGGTTTDGRRLGVSYVVRGQSSAAALPSDVDLFYAQGLGLGFTLESESAASHLGASVHGVGDVDGDGTGDIAIGAPGQGRVFVRLGSAGASSLETSSVTLVGSDPLDQLGWSVSAAGDVNGDGLPDVIVGAPGAGRAYVVFGSKDKDRWAAGKTVALASLNGNAGFALVADSSLRGLGYAVSAAGDFNHDGLDDVLVAAAQLNTTEDTAITGARVFVVFGRKQWPATVSVSALDGRYGFAVTDATEARPCTFVVASAGDVNGDRIPDVAIGSSTCSADGNWTAYVLFGGAGPRNATFGASAVDGTTGVALHSVGGASPRPQFVLSSAGDVNGDGVGDIVVGGDELNYVLLGHTGNWPASISGKDLSKQLVVLPGRNVGSQATAADINGDSLADIVRVHQGYLNHEGRIEVLFGRRDQWSSSLSGVDPSRGVGGFELTAAARTMAEHTSVSWAGDVNGDKVDDFVLGTPESSQGAGAAWVIYGSHEPRVKKSISAAQTALIGVPYSFPVPADAFEQAGGEQLRIAVALGGSSTWRWLMFNHQTNTIFGTPDKYDAVQTDSVCVQAFNARGIHVGQCYGLDIKSPLSLDIGANANPVRFGGEDGRETELAPIVIKTPAPAVRMSITSFTWVEKMFSRASSPDASEQFEKHTYEAEGSVEGVNKLLSRLVFRHDFYENKYTLNIAVTDSLGNFATAEISALRSGEDRLLTKGQIAGIVVGVVCGIAVIIGFSFLLGYVVNRRRRNNRYSARMNTW
eukprot:m51a1_g9964 hypothetical protein (1219) ;mRNA; r:78659-82315